VRESDQRFDFCLCGIYFHTHSKTEGCSKPNSAKHMHYIKTTLAKTSSEQQALIEV